MIQAAISIEVDTFRNELRIIKREMAHKLTIHNK